jgi:hypothetical protein
VGRFNEHKLCVFTVDRKSWSLPDPIPSGCILKLNVEAEKPETPPLAGYAQFSRFYQ